MLAALAPDGRTLLPLTGLRSSLGPVRPENPACTPPLRAWVYTGVHLQRGGHLLTFPPNLHTRNLDASNRPNFLGQPALQILIPETLGTSNRPSFPGGSGALRNIKSRTLDLLSSNLGAPFLELLIF